MTPTESKSPYRVQVLDRVFAVLDELAAGEQSCSLQELAEKLHLHKSTVHRLLMVLESSRMVERDPQSGRYRLGLRLFELGNVAIARFDVREKARRHLEKLVEEVDETVHLCALDAGEVLYLDRMEPGRSVRMECRVGRRNPVHCTSVGKAMLAYLPEREVDSILRQHGMERRTAKTLVTPAALKADLRAIRERGYAIDDEEIEDGVRCVGAAVVGADGRALAAISVSAPAFRMTMPKVTKIAGLVGKTAHALSLEYGYRGEWRLETATKVALKVKAS
jgi:DNA-binding IclR family transcriptional regulator